MTNQDKVFQILLAEDNPVDILMTKKALKRWQIKHELHVVENGNDVTDFLLKTGNYALVEKPDLLILDMNLPKKNGKEIMSEIRSNPEISDITVVIMTTADATFHFGIYDLGAKLFITKPMDLQGYIQAIHSIQEILQ